MTLRKFNNYDLEGFPPVLAWNPIAMRCDRVDEGCRNCWHLRYCNRAMKNPLFTEDERAAYRGHCNYAMKPLPRFPKKPSIIAIQFMGDLWNDNIPPRVCHDVLWESCVRHEQHIYLLLTKRPERVTEVLPDNCWLGTSVHDQASAGLRVPKLLATKAKHKWLSIEPMLGWVDVWEKDYCGLGKIEWVASGPETGSCARPYKQKWIDCLASQTKTDGIPFYDKRDPSAPGFTRREWAREWREKTGGEK